MAIAYVNSTNATIQSTSLAITVPTGGGTGDLVLFCVTNTGPISWSTPVGLTVFETIRRAKTSSTLFYRVVQAGDPTSYTFTQGSSVNSAAVCLRYSGVDPTVPVRFWSSAQTSTAGAVSTVTFATLQNVGASDLVVAFVAGNSNVNNVTTVISGPAGWASRQSVTKNTASVTSCATATFDKAAGTDTPAATGFVGFYVTQSVCLTDAAAPITTSARGTPAFGSASTASASAAGTSLVITKPAGVVDGDLLIACTADDFPNVFTITGTWTPLDAATPSTNTNAVTDNAAQLWWRIASSEPTSYTVGINASGSPCAAIVRYTGADPTMPIRMVEHVEATGIPTTSPAPTAILAQQASDMVVNFYTTGTDVSTTSIALTPPAGGWSTRANVPTTLASGFETAIAVVDKASAADFPTATSTRAGTWAVFSVALVGAITPSLVYKPARGPNYRR